MENKQKTPGFEERLQSVHELIAQIESGQLTLEQSVLQYEAGMKTLDELEKELGDMNRRLTVLRDGTEKETGDAEL